MGMLYGLREGTWWLHSEEDPRWKASGSANVGMFMTMESCAEAKAAYDSMSREFGKPPSDLEFGYMKD